MQRIAIIGCGGGGKSTLAQLLGVKLGLPVHHLDRFYWQPGWVETAKATWHALQVELCAQPTWIIDGNYGGTLELRLAAADTIVFIDLPTWVCLWGVVRRFIRYRGHTRPDMSVGCPERLDLRFLWWIWHYRRTHRPPILDRLRRCPSPQRVFVLESRQAIAKFLDEAV